MQYAVNYLVVEKPNWGDYDLQSGYAKVFMHF